MARNRRNTGWFFFLLALMLVCGYLILTYASAGTQLACGKAGPGSIKLVTKPVPKFDCVLPTFEG